MRSTAKHKLRSFFLFIFVTAIIIGWLFSGWPVIWKNPPVPPRIQEVEAETAGPNSPTTDKNSGGWTNPNNAISDGSGAAVTTAKNAEHVWWGFNFNITSGNNIDGIEVICDAWTGTDGPDKVEIYLSWDGSSWTAAKEQTWPSPNEDTITSGSSTDTWGRTWSTTEINSDNFRVKVKSIQSGKVAADWDLDWIRITVYHSVANQAPTVDSVAISPTPTITLNAGSTTTVTISATITDNNGCEDVFTSGSIVARFYRSGEGDSCDANNNDCYINITLTEVDDTCTGAGDYTGDASGTVNVQFHADPTDEGSYATSQGWNSQNWVAKVTATDEASDSGSNTSTVEIGTLIAFSLDQSSINYSTVNPDTVSTQQSVLVTTNGNAPIDIQLSGTDMTWSGNTIGVGQQKYSASSGFDWESAGTALTDSPVCHELSSGKPTDSPSNATEYTYWKLKVPTGKPAGGPYSGTNTFDVVADSVCP